MADEVLKPESPMGGPNIVFEPEHQAPKNNGFKKVLNKIKTYLSIPSNVIILVFGIFLSVVVLYPLFRMVLSSLMVDPIRSN